MKNRAFLGFALAFCMAAADAQPAPERIATFTIDIEDRNAHQALRKLADQTGLMITYGSRDVQGIFVNPVKGDMGYEQALQAMLLGTGLSYHADEFKGEVVILRRERAPFPNRSH